MPRIDPEVLAHLEWLGFVQPTGLVVSAPALVRAGAILDRRDAVGQALLRGMLDPDAPEDEPAIGDFEQFARDVLGWQFSPKGYAGTGDSPIPDELHVVLPDYEDTLVPDFAVRERNPADGAPAWQLLITVLPTGTDLDAVASGRGLLEASPHGRMERLLRETGVSAGLICNGRTLRLVSAPRGESSGWLQFEVAAMTQTAGRAICTAMRLLLGQQRLLTLPKEKRLAALLDDSRKFQNEVSEKLAEQVLHALYELLRGLQAAHDASDGSLLRDPLDRDADEVYHGLLTVILRLVFLLYAEERDMLPTENETFTQYYSLAGLFARLRDHAAHFPDTMDQRYGAWAQLLVLFRMVHDGASAGDVKLPPRHGGLFDPDRYPFLEGRPAIGGRQKGERIEPPRVPDGTVFRAMEKLLVLDGERLSYRALDVEQIGSVYQTMMGFRLETATGRSLAVRAAKRLGAPTTINLDELVEVDAGKREKWIKDAADRDLPARVKTAVNGASSIVELHSALAPVMDRNASPDVIPTGAMVLQPSDERRKSGSHYTPRALTEPIVRTTLKPLLDALRANDRPPAPEQLLDLKICDPAMGSAAFLVEACRQLGDELIASWAIHGGRPEIPADEDEVVFARRLVAQRCLYGLDRNPVAVDLAKMSLWLVTLAREHALTFLDHALRSGDALVGLSRRQIQAFHWDDTAPPLPPVEINQRLDRVAGLRQEIREASEEVSDFELRDMWDEAQYELAQVRLYGDLVMLAFFSGDSKHARETKRAEYLGAVTVGDIEQFSYLVDEARHASPPLAPFHWSIEFPEVFQRENPGFDAFLGNPPFMGGTRISNSQGREYLEFLTATTPLTTGNVDLAAFFVRRADSLLRLNGCLGLITTNSVGAGDSGRASLTLLVGSGRELLLPPKEQQWPGVSANVAFLPLCLQKQTDAIKPPMTPAVLASNDGLCNRGCDVFGAGFVLSDGERSELIGADPRSGSVIQPYIGGKEFNNSPRLEADRYIINFGEMTQAEARQYRGAFARVEELVRPARENVRQRDRRELWWLYATRAPNVNRFLGNHSRVLAIAQISKHLAFAFLPRTLVSSNTLLLFLDDRYSFFAVLQSRVHQTWVNRWAGAMRQDIRYTSTDCFETFPRPLDGRLDAAEDVGNAYYQHRQNVCIANNEGLTATYNRFHDPEESSLEFFEFRKLHEDMDRAVLDAYGWTDIPTSSEFVLDDEVEREHGASRRKRPYRYRWPDDVHDEVLARLLALNAERAAEERRSGSAAAKATGKRAAKQPGSKSRSLF